MDMPWGGPGPFSYLVGEHARAIVAIQELQQEVTSLLSFREHVLETLPHLKEPKDHVPETSPRTRPSSSSKSLTETTSCPPSSCAVGHHAPTGGPSTVVDSGFSTDKASTSMGKSSSSSSGGDLSGGARWTCVEPDTVGPPGPAPPLGSAEDELWQLLDVIQRKGSRLRSELERAEQQERELGHVSDPSALSGTPNHFPGHRGVSSVGLPPPPVDFWPHSLPGGITPRLDFLSPGMEVWGETERLRQDRSYLLGRVSRAEAEAAASHNRLLDLHSQLLSLATEKRRLEDAFRTLRIMQDPSRVGAFTDHTPLQDPYLPSPNWYLKGGSDNTHVQSVYGNSTSKVHIGDISPKTARTPRNISSGVTVSVKGDSKLSDQSRRHLGATKPEEVILPRVLKVSIKDKSDKKSPKTSSVSESPQNGFQAENHSVAVSQTSNGVTLGADRVVIERQRTTNKVDGGLSMPASLLKGSRIKVSPDKQRISAILKEKDVLALQKQLLTTVMETEVLKRQLECVGEEWASRLENWEVERQRGQDALSSLSRENKSLREQLEARRKSSNEPRVEVHEKEVMATPQTISVGISTVPLSPINPEDNEPPTHSVHPGPNVKYDVVVYEESSRETPSPAPRKNHNSIIEKPPRRSRECRSSLSNGTPSPSQTPISITPRRVEESCHSSSSSFGKDSLSRVAKVSLKTANGPTSNNTLTTNRSVTPRSSPASSISKGVSRSIAAEGSTVGRTPPHLRNLRGIVRKDSLKSSHLHHSSSSSLGNNKAVSTPSVNNKGSSKIESRKSVISASSEKGSEFASFNLLTADTKSESSLVLGSINSSSESFSSCLQDLNPSESNHSIEKSPLESPFVQCPTNVVLSQVRYLPPAAGQWPTMGATQRWPLLWPHRRYIIPRKRVFDSSFAATKNSTSPVKETATPLDSGSLINGRQNSSIMNKTKLTKMASVPEGNKGDCLLNESKKSLTPGKNLGIRSLRKRCSGPVRFKTVDRPSVLSLMKNGHQETDVGLQITSYIDRGSPIGNNQDSSSRKGGASRVGQIVARINRQIGS